MSQEFLTVMCIMFVTNLGALALVIWALWRQKENER